MLRYARACPALSEDRFQASLSSAECRAVECGLQLGIFFYAVAYLIRFKKKKWFFFLEDLENIFVTLSPPLSKLAWLYVCWHPKAEMSADTEGNRREMLTPSRD